MLSVIAQAMIKVASGSRQRFLSEFRRALALVLLSPENQH